MIPTAKTTKLKVKVFLASPADVEEERKCVREVVEEFKKTVCKLYNLELELLGWDTDSWPDVGEDAQDVINRQIGEYDVFLGLMWKRVGTRTRRASSGTIEEFRRAYDFHSRFKRPKIMFYFSRQPFYVETPSSWKEFKAVLCFQEELRNLGVYFRYYKDVNDFQSMFRIHLFQSIFGDSDPVL